MPHHWYWPCSPCTQFGSFNNATSFWPFPFAHAIYLINVLPSPSLKHLSPFFLLQQTHPTYTDVRVFRCECWTLINPYNKHKFSCCSLPCVFLGLSPSHEGFICYHIPTSWSYILKDVQFYETHFSLLIVSKPTPTPTSTHTHMSLSPFLSFINSFCPRQFTDDTIKWPPPQALLGDY